MDKPIGPKIDKKTCIGCLACMTNCPVAPPVISTKDGKAYAAYPETCIYCSACAMNCPMDAIKLEPTEGSEY